MIIGSRSKLPSSAFPRKANRVITYASGSVSNVVNAVVSVALFGVSPNSRVRHSTFGTPGRMLAARWRDADECGRDRAPPIFNRLVPASANRTWQAAQKLAIAIFNRLQRNAAFTLVD